MFTFKKPKKNLRVRETQDEESENETDGSMESSSLVKPTKKPKKPIAHQPLLSFQEDLNEGDDGEVFKVKKSNQSKKIKKQLEKERKKKKEKPGGAGGGGGEDEEGGEGARSGGANGQSSIKPPSVTTIQHLDDDIVIKLKNTFPVLNGREAEAADADGGLSSGGEEEAGAGASLNSRPSPRFIKQTDSVKLLLKRGSIPDAAAIHAARKQRQHLRELGESLPAQEDITTSESSSKSRLVREDEASDGEEEERITMTVSTAAEDKVRRRAEFHAAQNPDIDESDKGEEDEWEAQQIRKGVTGAQIAAVQQESLYYQAYLGNGTLGGGGEVEGLVAPTLSATTVLEQQQLSELQQQAPFMVFPPLPSTSSLEPSEVIKKLKDRLSDLNEVHRRHKLDTEAHLEQIQSLKAECARITEEGPKRAERFRFYQDLRGYVTDLVECLNEKIVILELLEKRAASVYSKRVSEGVARRRQDVMDQASELAPTSVPQQRLGRDRDEALSRRVAEREGRRIRRQRYRELRGIQGHMEGMSSDEEITEAEAVNLRNVKDIIEEDGGHVLEDVLEEFGTVGGVLERFEGWRREDMSAYSEAYVSLCLPKLLSPLVRLSLLLWNPLCQEGSVDFEKAPWYSCLVTFGLSRSETEEELRKDPDALLIPRVIEQIILRKLTDLVKECWDPLSSSQTLTLVGLVTKLLQDYPTLSHKSKSVTAFFEAVIEKMKETVDNDVYIPIYTPQRMTESKVVNFFLRQCVTAIKLLGNMTRWQGLLSDSLLSEVALGSLLNRSLLMALRTSCSPHQAALLVQMIGNVLPRVWLQVCVHPPLLANFLSQAKTIARGLDIEKPLDREALERMSGVLKAAGGTI